MRLNRFTLIALTAGVSIAAAQSKSMPETAPGSREIVPISANWHFQMDVNDLGEKERWYEKDCDRSAWAKATVQYSPEWLKFWLSQFQLYTRGQAHVQFTIDAIRAIMRATPHEEKRSSRSV